MSYIATKLNKSSYILSHFFFHYRNMNIVLKREFSFWKWFTFLSNFQCGYIGKLILWSLLFFVIFFTVTVLKCHYIKDHFPTMLWSNTFFPISWPLPLISVILYHYSWKKFPWLVRGVIPSPTLFKDSPFSRNPRCPHLS